MEYDVIAKYSNSSCDSKVGKNVQPGKSANFPNEKDCGPQVTVTAKSTHHSCKNEETIPSPDLFIYPDFSAQ